MNRQRRIGTIHALAAVPLGAVLLLGGCESRMGMMGGGMKKDQMMMPEPNAASVQAHLQKERYQTWRMFPGKGAMYKGGEPHGMLLTTYVNETAYKALMARSAAMPDGAILVKENYTPDRRLAAVTTMVKRSGYHPSGGDWFWMKTAADGKVEASGKVGGCIGCHGASQRDYVLTPMP